MTINVAFFISSVGAILHVPDNHISTVIADPERFGLTMEEIRAVYDRHGEKVGTEGEARKELLLTIINQGWIRIRRYPNKDRSINVFSLTPDVQELLRNRAEKCSLAQKGSRNLTDTCL